MTEDAGRVTVRMNHKNLGILQSLPRGYRLESISPTCYGITERDLKETMAVVVSGPGLPSWSEGEVHHSGWLERGKTANGEETIIGFGVGAFGRRPERVVRLKRP